MYLAIQLRSLTTNLTITALSLVLTSPASASSCADSGLAPNSGIVIQLREAAQKDRSVMVYRDVATQAWFVPLQDRQGKQGRRGEQGDPVGVENTSTTRPLCDWRNVVYSKIDAHDAALQIDTDNDTLAFMDIHQVTDVIDQHRAVLKPTAQTLDSAGVNYQLAFNYSSNATGSELRPSAYTDLYASRNGWYYDTTLGWNNAGRIARYETYALRESVDSGTFLRLGDATSGPTALGEAQQFAGLSWGTAQALRPGDFLPVLPTLRNGNSLAGRLDVFINDTLQFQQTLQSGVYDLRNLPAQQGFNSYSVRTLDAQGNPVTVQREIYLAASLLPAGISSFRIDAGFRREDFFSANAHYGAPLVAGSYARGIDENVTLSGRTLVSAAASTAAAEYDQHLSDLWTGHLGWLLGRNRFQVGQAMQARLEGGGKWWQLLADWTEATNPLPGLGDRSALIKQQLVHAQLNAIAGWGAGLTVAHSQHEFEARTNVVNLTATTQVLNSAATLLLGLTHSHSVNVAQNSATVSLFMPLAPGNDQKNRLLYVSHDTVEDAQLTRAQYTSNSPLQRNSSWNIGTTQDSRASLSSVDASWTGATDKTELLANGRTSLHDNSAQVSLRSGVVWTGGSMFLSRPITGAFALVSTEQEGVAVEYENRPAGRTNGQGLLLVPDLRALEVNQISLDPTFWPIQWTSVNLKQEVVPPRGGGVQVSFRINAKIWPSQAMVTPLGRGGTVYPPGTVVYASADGEPREAVIDRQGQVWLAELMPAATFNIRQDGQYCEFSMPLLAAAPDHPDMPLRIQPLHCKEAS